MLSVSLDALLRDACQGRVEYDYDNTIGGIIYHINTIQTPTHHAEEISRGGD